MNFYTVVLNTKQNESDKIINKLWDTTLKAVDLPENTSPDSIVNDGYYNLYTTIDGKKYRWILHNKAITTEAQVYYRIQTAYYFMGEGTANNVRPIQRNIYYNGNAFGFTEWHEI